MATDDFTLLEAEFAPYLVGNRTESTAMLAWFLEHVWRIEPEDAEEALCDGSNDKGVDAIVVDHDAREIAVLQGKRRRSPDRTQGNSELERLRGIDTYFRGPEGVDALLQSSPNEELRLLIDRLKVRDLLAGDEPYTVRLVAVTNAQRDAAAEDYLASNARVEPSLELWDRQQLAAVARRTRRPGLLGGTFTLLPTGDVLREPLADRTSLVFALISANELVRLPGIDDLTLFALNVRLSLGRTRINKELARTIREEQSEHRMFPAYHNGLTLLTERLEVDGEGLHLHGVSVVNGCQSLLALHANQDRLTPELNLLTKVVELGDDPTLADTITYRSNNQNPVNIRDQRANDAIQRDLQQQVTATYACDFFYSIRRGEPAPDGVPVFDNQLAAQLITAIWLHEPWNAVRKLRLFDEEYRRIFARSLDAHRLLLAYRLNCLIEAQRPQLRGEVSASFAAARFTIAHIVAEVCRLNDLGKDLLAQPDRWLPERQAEVADALGVFVEHVVDELNVYVESREEERRDDPARPVFDAKVAFKSASAIRDVTRHVLSMTRHAVKRYDDFLFAVDPVR